MEDRTKLQPSAHQSTFQIGLIIFVITLGTWYWGYVLGVLNTALDTLHVIYKIDGENSSVIDGFLTASVAIGGFIGSFLASLWFSMMSRRKALIIFDLLGIIACLFTIMPNLIILLIGRFFTGVVAGLNTTLVTAYVKEISPVGLMGFSGNMMSITRNVGYFIAYLFGLGFPEQPDDQDQYYWRIVIAFPIVFCIIRCFFLIFFYQFDTPYNYLCRGKQQEARNLVAKLYQEDQVDQVMWDYLSEFRKSKNSGRVTFCDLRQRRYRKRVTVGIGLMFFAQYCGTSTLIYYSTLIFQQATEGNRMHSVILTIFISGFTPMAVSLLSGILVNKYGRRFQIIQGELSAAIILVLLAFIIQYSDGSFELNIILICIMFIYRFSVSIGIGPGAYAYVGDILPEKGVAICYQGYWLFTASIGQLFPIVQKQIGLGACFFGFAIITFYGSYFSWKNVQETKGLSRVEIEDLFDDENQKQIEIESTDQSASKSPKNGIEGKVKNHYQKPNRNISIEMEIKQSFTNEEILK